MKEMAINELTEQFELILKYSRILHQQRFSMSTLPLANISANQNSPSINNYCNSAALKTNRKANASIHSSRYISFRIVSLNIQIRAF